MNKNDERILVIGKEVFDKTGLTEEMLSAPVRVPESVEDQRDMVGFLNDAWEVAGEVKRRGDVEEDTTYLQPIPSIILKRGDEYFAYKRLEGGGEERLHNMGSLTVGGHMNLEQEEYWNFEHLLALGAARELEEEIYILDKNGKEINNHFEITKEMPIVGLIYSDKTPVDSVHLGLLAIITIPEEWDIKVKETDALEGSFKTLDEIKEMNLENWSKMALNVLV